MADAASSVLAPWASFYIITGSSAAALTGLMFVVLTLVAGVERGRSRDGISTFSTLTVVAFCAALFVSLVLSVPWRSLIGPATLLGLFGVYGVVYLVIVIYRTRRLRSYSADLDDWFWYTILPLVSYGAILAGGILLAVAPTNSVLPLAGAVTLLIFIGIRNAWDVVTFIVTGGLDEPPKSN